MHLTPKDWHEFQHYNKRNPPWIKLHKDLLDNSIFQMLPDASRALAPMLWLLASKEKCGTFNGASNELAFRLRQSEEWVDRALKPLIDSGLFIVASNVLASCQQHATPETEAEAEAETDFFQEGNLTTNTKGVINNPANYSGFTYNPDEVVGL